jgi:hypothetical protein
MSSKSLNERIDHEFSTTLDVIRAAQDLRSVLGAHIRSRNPDCTDKEREFIEAKLKLIPEFRANMRIALEVWQAATPEESIDG